MAIREVAAVVPGTFSIPPTKDVAKLREDLLRGLQPYLRATSIVADNIEARLFAITSSYTVVDETVILADATGGAITVTIPTSTSETTNLELYVKRLNSGANTVTVAAQGSDTIDGAGTVVLASQYASVHIISDGVGAWWKL